MRISTVILRVSDLSASVVFYRDALGLTLDRETPNFAYFRAGSVTLAVNEAPAEKAGAGDCLTEIALEVADIHAEFARLTAAGVAFLMEPTHVAAEADHDLYAAAFRDPDGHLLSITSRVARV